MKFSIARETLLTPLQQVIGVIEKRQTLPILSNVLLRLQDGRLELTGTDLEVQLVTRATVDAPDSDPITVPARKLLDIFRLLPERSEVSIETKEDRFAIRCGGSRFSLTTLPADNYPEFDAGSMDFEIAVPTEVLRTALAKTSFAMAQQDVRYYLNGLLLDIDGATVRTVASDGHRLAVFQEVFPENFAGARQVIIPRKGVLELSRLLGDADDTLGIQFSSNAVRINLGAVSFSAKLVDGRFPDFQRVMPRDLSHFYTVEKEAFRSSLVRASVLCGEKTRSISLGVEEDGMMAINAQNPEHEEAEERLAVVSEGGTLAVGFNVSYLLDAVQNVDATQVRLSFTPTANSCLVEDPMDNRFRFIVMPMRL